MNYISVREASDKWGISRTLVRRYCGQNRIPKAKCQDGVWLIPEKARKPEKIQMPIEKNLPLYPLASKLVSQKKKKNYHGLYDYVQIEMAYSFSRMASNRLTRNQVETIFRKGKVRESFEPMKVSDLIEVMNHCACVDFILDHINEPMTQKMIQHLHSLLMAGTVDERMGRVVPGVYRTESSIGRSRRLHPAAKINSSLGELIKRNEKHCETDCETILDFHVRFEQIFPFEDGNGRIGRLIMFKECLRHDVMPFILDDKRRHRYLHGLQEWSSDRTILCEVISESQTRFESQIELQKLMARRHDFLPAGIREDGE